MYTFRTPLEDRPLFLNKFNPTIKLICAILLIVLGFLCNNVIAQAATLVLVISLWISAKLPYKKFKPIIRTFLILFFLILLINWLVSKDPGVRIAIDQKYQLWGSSWTTLFNKGWINQYRGYFWVSGQIWGGSVGTLVADKPFGSFTSIAIDGQTFYLPYSAPLYALSSKVLITSVSMSLKLFCMLIVFSLLVNTTSAMQLTYAFEHLLWPLKWIKVPVTEISYIIATAIRFVPSLFDEANKIINAQASRGCDFRNGRLLTKIKAIGTIVVPMFAASFNHADKLSDAMEARNFVPRAKRTKYRVYHCLWSHWVSFAILICLLALFIYLRVCKVIIYPFIAIDCFII